MNNMNEIAAEMETAIKQVKMAQAMITDAKLAAIRADRKLGPAGVSESLSIHIKQLEGLIKEHGNCAMFMEATLVTLMGDDNPDVDITESR